MTLSGQTILITGAAGRIGSASVHAVLKAGAKVILADISVTRLQDIAIEFLSIFPNSVKAIHSDVTTEQGVDDLFEEITRNYERLDGVVHCAYPKSDNWGAGFEELNTENLNQNLIQQLGGAIIFSQRTLNLFKSQGGGNLIHISSIQGVSSPKFEHYEGTSMTSPVEYAAIKAGVIAITSWLAKYHSNQGIRVNCISPGGILDAQPSSFQEKYRKSCTNIGMLSAEHVASAVIFLLSSNATAINGHNLIVDDGWTL